PNVACKSAPHPGTLDSPFVICIRRHTRPYPRSAMRICIFGAGAVGGHIAVGLAAGGNAEISVIARGDHLRAIQRDGMTLRISAGESWHARFTHATDDASTLPPQDVVFVALKANSLPDQAQAIARLLGNDGTAVFLNNGIPWWWNHGTGNENATTLELLDPRSEEHT